jgi:hypothetical protein
MKNKIEKIKQIKSQIESLSEEKKAIEESLTLEIKENEDGSKYEYFSYQNEDGTYTRYTRIDNIEELKSKGQMYRNTPINRYTVKIENLKNLPKELKG